MELPLAVSERNPWQTVVCAAEDTFSADRVSLWTPSCITTNRNCFYAIISRCAINIHHQLLPASANNLSRPSETSQSHRQDHVLSPGSLLFPYLPSSALRLGNTSPGRPRPGLNHILCDLSCTIKLSANGISIFSHKVRFFFYLTRTTMFFSFEVQKYLFHWADYCTAR